MRKDTCYSKRFSLRVYSWLLFFISMSHNINAHQLTIQGEQFFLDGQKFKMYGIRVASGTSINTSITMDGRTPFSLLLQQLDTYKACGVNTITVFYEGSGGDRYNPFSPDGKSFTYAGSGHNNRMKMIIEACNERAMVVIVGIFYQYAPFAFANAEAVKNVIRLVTNELKPFQNIIINVCNEQNSSRWSSAARVWDFRIPSKIIDLCQIVHQVDSNRLVGNGGYDHIKNDSLVKSPDLDVLLFDSSDKDVGINNCGVLYDRFSAVLSNANLRQKPIVNVELYGGWSAKFVPPGVYPESDKNIYFRDIDAAASRPGLSVFFHSDTWLQGPSRGFKMRYDLGGSGTSDDPGIKWVFEYIQSKINPPLVWSSQNISPPGSSGNWPQFKETFTTAIAGALIFKRRKFPSNIFHIVSYLLA